MPSGMCSVQNCIQITHNRTPSENVATAATRSVRARTTMLLLLQRRPSVVCACHRPWKMRCNPVGLLYITSFSPLLPASCKHPAHSPNLAWLTEEGVVLDERPCRGESGSHRLIHLERDLKSSHLNPGIATRHCIG